MNAREFYQKLADLNPDRDYELVTVIRGEHAGAKVLLANGESAAATDGSDADTVLGMPEESLLRERLGRPKTIVVCGAGYVGQSVIRLGKILGWKVIAIDDRIEFAAAARRAGADSAIADAFETALSGGRVPYGSDTYFVVVTRGHRYDRECLLEIMKHEFAYAGMMGSRARSARMRQTLEQEQIPKEKADMLHAPIGIRIGAQTPEEIAVSIWAEIIDDKQHRPDRDVIPEEIPEAIAQTEPGSCVLATIARRKGSAPRQAGTRMLIRRDRSTVGTIGGGCMEAEAVTEAMTLLAARADRGGCADGPEKAELFTVDLTGRTGKSADMLCGGVMEVLLEVL